ncbi:hypothetical protein B0O99DRAFT_597651 [Bisporella sp. PMI_857]|nr:hypothetical protein B0O99DRAFT_597651 [Bisporella sp. PMI_857]
MAFEAPERFAGWEIYPCNLPFSALDTNATRCQEELSKDAQRLFIPNEEESELQILQIDTTSQEEGERNPQQLTIGSPEQLLSCLERPANTIFFQVTQEHSWSQLLITEELFRKLLTILNVHPGFLDVVHVFEVAYNVKYVARHRRNSPLKDPFSIRETGVYHKLQTGLAKCTWIFLNPSETLSERLAKASTEPEASEPLGQFRWHALILLCLSESWRDYVNHLEENLSNLMDRGFSSNRQQSNRDGIITVDFSDIRSLQIMTDKLKRLIHLLNLNKNLCEHLSAFFGRVKSLSPPQLAGSFCQYEIMIENYSFQNETHISRLESIVSRAQGVGSLIEHILDLRAAEQGAEENSLVRQLTLQSTEDTGAMRTIALISAIFLPATFLATFFGSNFFGFEDTKDGHILTVASNIWIYVVAALAFSAITVAIWCWWRSRSWSKSSKGNDAEYMA